MTGQLDVVRDALASGYDVARELGQGGMATVYLAVEHKHDRQVAVKVLRPEIAALLGPERFLREIRIAARLSHPHIVPLLASGQAGNILYYVMPFVDGESLRARLDRERQLPIETVLRITREIAGALTYSHAQGIVHRDIKPENVMLSGGVAVVADFGIATAVGQAGSSRLTDPGFSVGTPIYMSPEQVSGGVDGRSDVYSLGCVVYEMLTGEPPYTGPTAVAVVTRHAVSPIPPIRTIRPDASDAIERALIRALAKAPADRFATADEFALALEAHSTGVTPAVEANGTVTLESSIAVLPFVDLSRERDQSYLCEGIAEELRDALGRLGSLRVASRTSAFALTGQNLDVREIGRRLNVRSVLEGAVRAAGDRLRVSVTLTNVEDGYQSWSVRYDRAMTDVFEVQDEIARTVVSRLQPQSVSGSPVVAPGASDPEAYRAYLLGRHFANRRTESGLRHAIASFESGLAREPGFALAAAGLADAWFMLGVYGAVAPDEAMKRAKSAVEQAEASGRETAEALAVRGSIRAVYDWDWSGAEADFQRALALGPGNPTVLHRYAVNCLLPRGRFTEAAASLRAALDHDPLSLVTTSSIGLLHYLSQRSDEAITTLRSVVDLDPHFGLAKYFLGLALLEGARPEEAVAVLEEAMTDSSRGAETLAALGSACAVAGRLEDATRILAELETRSHSRYVSPVLLAQLVLALGRPEDALARLEQGREKRATEMVWLGVRPTWASLKTERRFQALMEQVGLG